jgi:DegV family protein with EDD domain
MSIRIITDSACDITQAEAKQLNIDIIPLKTIFGEEEFLDGVTLDHKTFYNKLVESDVLPTTSQISPFDYEERYRAAVESGDDVLCITISSKLSGCHQSACIAAEEFPGKVIVVDSLNAAIGERLLVELAISARDEGKCVTEIAALLNEQKHHIRLIALLDTLEYLKKGGRISSASAFAGTLLSIKPVIAIENGEVATLGKARGSKQANNLLVQKINETGGIDFEKPILLGYTGLTDVYLKKYVEDSAHLWADHKDALPYELIGSVVGTHAGPGAFAAAFFVKDQLC